MIKILGHGNVYIGVVEARAVDGTEDRKAGLVLQEWKGTDKMPPIEPEDPFVAQPEDFVMLFDTEESIDTMEAALKEVRMMIHQYAYQKELRKKEEHGTEAEG